MSLINNYRKPLSSLRSETLLLCGDPDGESFSTSRVDRELNNAALEFAIKTQCVKDEINVLLRKTRQEYDIRQLVEEDGTLRDYGIPLRIGFNGSKQPAMWPTTQHEVDMLGHEELRYHLDTVSPNKIRVLPVSADGTALPSEDGNMQVSYLAFPSYMSNGDSYPDAHILATFHQALPFGAAYRLLDEGTPGETDRAISMEAQFLYWINTAISESYRGQTAYDDVRPG